MEFPDSEYWIHEAGITRYLGLPKNAEYCPSEALAALIYRIKNSYGITARTKISVGLSTNKIVDGGASSAVLSILSMDQG